MNDKKYSIGTKIRFLNSEFDTGMVGTIVGYWGFGDENPAIYLPTADKHIKYKCYPILLGGIRFTWKCHWNELEILVQKNQQLLFNFMKD